MSQERIGLWLIGAWGGVSTTVAVGLAGLQAGVAPEIQSAEDGRLVAIRDRRP